MELSVYVLGSHDWKLAALGDYPSILKPPLNCLLVQL